MARRAIRAAPPSTQGGGGSDARLAERGRRCRPRGLGAAQPLKYRRGREPPRVADHRRRTRVSQHAPLPPVAARGAARRSRARAPTGPTPPTGSTRRCWRTRWAWRCSSCSRRSAPPSGSRPCCTTCSACRLGLLNQPALVNGAAGWVSTREGRPFSVAGCTIRDGKIVEIDIVADPARLGRLDLTILRD
jgi:hypothetical protein